MTISKLFPKKKMDEVFNKYGFHRLKSLDGITYKNKFEITVAIYRSRFEKGIFFLDHSTLAAYGLKIDGYKREWKDEEALGCFDFIEINLLPKLYNLKGPYNMKYSYVFKKIVDFFSKYVISNKEQGTKNFMIPFNLSEIEKNFNYLKFCIDDNRTLVFLNKLGIYKILLVDDSNKKELYHWYDFADRDKEGDELLSQMVENIAVFLKLKK